MPNIPASIDEKQQLAYPHLLLIAPKQLHQPIGIIGDDTIHTQIRHSLHVRLFVHCPGQDGDLTIMGVADLYAETGEDSLWSCLDRIWEDVVYRKMYITGGCGALYDGVSPDAVSYNPAQIQEIHQAYGRGYQLPNTTAHNETTLQETPARPFSIFLRIPGWCKGASLLVNGQHVIADNGYTAIHRRWKAGDQIELLLPMPVVLSVANPMVEETRNQAAVRRGPMVYCLESPDLPAGTNLLNVTIPAHPHLIPVETKIGNTRILRLLGSAKLLPTAKWEKKLYQDLSPAPASDIPIRLVPYYAWANRGASDMTVWLPVVQ